MVFTEKNRLLHCRWIDDKCKSFRLDYGLFILDYGSDKEVLLTSEQGRDKIALEEFRYIFINKLIFWLLCIYPHCCWIDGNYCSVFLKEAK